MIDGRIVIYGLEGQKNGCNFYRIRQPMQKIISKDLFPACLSSNLPSMDDQTAWMEGADIVFSQLSKSQKYLNYMNDWKGRKKFVVDYDDNIFCVSPYNPAYSFHGTTEVDVSFDGSNGGPFHLWKDGQNDFNIEENKKRIQLFIETLKMADLVTTTSPILCGIFKSHGAKKVRMIKNCLDFKVWYPVNIERTSTVTIGYQGGWSHFEDWIEIQDALEIVMKQFPQTRLLIMGQHYDGTLKNLDRSRLSFEPWTDAEIYPWKFKTLGIDIGICPLKNTEFNICKSEVKWEEYSALAIPTVASNIPPYSSAVSHGTNGLLAKTKEEWIQCLTDLILSKDLRKSLGDAARQHVLENYDIENKLPEYKNAFDSVFNRELVIV